MSDCPAVDYDVLIEAVDAAGSRVAVSQNERPQNTKDKGTAPHCGHLRHSQTPDVQAWLVKHPRFHMHFTPTSVSWLNMVERFFRDITDKRIRHGVFTSVADLEAAIKEYIAAFNAKPKPFIWTAKASDILAKVIRARTALNKSSSN